MIKYRLAFTMPAETLFALMAKVLPIEDLSVEEIVEPAPPARASGPPHQLAKPKKPRGIRAPGSYKFDLKAGVNSVLMGVMSDGQIHPTSEFKSAMKSHGYGAAGTSSALAKLLKRGVAFQPELASWQLTKEYRQKQSA